MKNTKFVLLFNLITVMVVLLVNGLIWQLLGRISLLSTAVLLIIQAAITWVVLTRRAKLNQDNASTEP